MAVVLSLFVAGRGVADELPTLAGPAMGTTYRVTLVHDLPGLSRGEVHREVEAVLARIDRAASGWRDDSEVSRFNRAAAGEWVPVSAEFETLVAAARAVHAQSDGAFDITVGPLVRLWGGGPRQPGPPTRPSAEIDAVRAVVGMRLIEVRPATAVAGAAVRKSVAGVEIDLGGIAPGHAVDCIGARLAALGSPAHLVEVGGEVRAWGEPAAGRPWRVRLRGTDAQHGEPHEIELPAGSAVAASTCRPGRSPIDPRTGRPAAGPPRTAIVRAGSCATADAWAVAAVLLGLEPDDDGTITVP
jgi:thiamine biosynthesis lipoprotein